MADEIKNAFDYWQRDYVTEGVPASGRNPPHKRDGRRAGEVIQDQFDAVNDRVDEVETGFADKQAVDLMPTVNVTLSGEQTIDGVLTSVSIVLVGNAQTNKAQIGPHITGPGAWTRVADSDTGAEMVNATWLVKSGTVNGNTRWKQTVPGPITLGSTNLLLAQIGSADPISQQIADDAAASAADAAQTLEDVEAVAAPILAGLDGKQDKFQIQKISEFTYRGQELPEGADAFVVDSTGLVIEYIDAEGNRVFVGEYDDKQDGFVARELSEFTYRGVIPAGSNAIVTDSTGLVIEYIDGDGLTHRQSYGDTPISGFSEEEKARHNMEAAVRSQEIENRPIGYLLQPLVAGVNAVTFGGQSLGDGANMYGVADPDSTAPAAALMIGNSTRSDSKEGRLFTSSGGAHVTGGTGGVSSSVLTISAVEFGKVVVGQKVSTNSSGTTLATISTLGTSTGGTGTVNLNTSITLANGSKIMLADGAYDAFTPLVPRVRRYEPVDNVWDGNPSAGSPPYSADPASALYHRNLAFVRANSGFAPVDYAVIEAARALNTRYDRDDSYNTKKLVGLNGSLGSSNLTGDWQYLGPEHDYDPGRNYLLGERIRDTSSFYGAWRCKVASSTGVAPTPGADNANWEHRTDCFHRLTSSATLTKSVAQATYGGGVGLANVIFGFIQGTNNAGRGTRLDYLNGQRQLLSDFRTHVEAGVYGQSKPGMFIIYAEQTNDAGYSPGQVWDDETTYGAGDITRANGGWWVSPAGGNLNKIPGTDPEWVRCRIRAEFFSGDTYTIYDIATVGDRGFLCKVDGIITSPLQGGSVDTANWTEIIGGTWTKSSIAVDDAKLDHIKEDPTVYHAGCGYSWWFKRDVHGTANWPRHAGVMIEKLVQHVMLDGKYTRPLHCYEAIYRGRQILLKMHVPVGDLAFQRVYIDGSDIPVMLPSRGVRAFDNAAPLPNGGTPNTGIDPAQWAPSRGLATSDYTVEIIGSHTILLTANRNLQSPVIAFADPAGSYGITNIVDGDTRVSRLKYRYSAGTDMDPWNEASLDGVPFDLRNHCVPHTVTCIAA